jgi:hypothetical protein
VPQPERRRQPGSQPDPDGAAVRLTGDGIDTPQRCTTFGETFEQVQPALVAALGRAEQGHRRIGSFSAYGTCPGSKLRVLEFDGGALRVCSATSSARGHHVPVGAGRAGDEVPQASALVGDVTTYEFGVGDTVADLRAGVQGGAELEVEPGDEMFAPSFTLLTSRPASSASSPGRPTATPSPGAGGEGCGE